MTNFPCITMRFSQHILWGKVRVPVASKDWLVQSPHWRTRIYICSTNKRIQKQVLLKESFLKLFFLIVAFFFFFIFCLAVFFFNLQVRGKNCKLNCKDVSKVWIYANGWRKKGWKNMEKSFFLFFALNQMELYFPSSHWLRAKREFFTLEMSALLCMVIFVYVVLSESF